MIRQVKPEDITAVLAIYKAARAFMRANGNPTQWGNSYPEKELLEDDIRKSNLYLCERNGLPCGVFMLMAEPESTYREIDGAWKNDSPYGTIHRVASNGSEKGVFSEILEYSKARFSHLRIDTHADNHVMQRLLTKGGFEYCGVIRLENGDLRLAYEYMAD